MKQTVIVGAGVAGLTLASRLCGDRRVTMIEKENRPGGLARSFRYGNLTFDIGPHRFYTADAPVADFIARTLGANRRTIHRRSGIRFKGRYYEWPFHYTTLLSLPFGIEAGALLDLLTNRRREIRTYEDYVLSQYGRTIYRNFFQEYTRKFLGLQPSEVDPEWGRLSVERSVIDRSVKASSIIDLFNSLLLARPVQLDFLYPERGGTQAFADALALQTSCSGVSFLPGRTVKRLITGRDRIKTVVTTKGDRLDAEELVWSAPLTELMRLLKMEDTELRFLDTLLYNLETDVLPRRPYQWCYFGEKETCFVRYSVPSYFSPRNASGENYGLCVEMTCYRSGALWKHPEERTETVIRDLVRNDVIPHANNVRSVRIERIENTYPVYTLGYRSEVEAAMAELSRFKNLRLLGRSGKFWYNNLDHSIRQALDMAEAMLLVPAPGRAASSRSGSRRKAGRR